VKELSTRIGFAPGGKFERRHAAAALFWAGFWVNFLLIVGRLVDFPYLDEWDYVTPGALGSWPEPSFLLRQHSDHRMVTTHLQTWALFRLADWNLVTGAVFNYFFVFSLIPLLLARIGRLQLRRANWILWLFLLSILTPFNPYHQFGVLMVGIEHYVVLFLLSVMLLFESEQRTSRLVLGSLSAVAATYAVGAGAISSAVTVAALGAYKYARIRSGQPRGRELRQWLVVAGLLVPAAVIWFLTHQQVEARPPLAYPTTPAYWKFLFALSALGVGQPGSVWAGVALVALGGLPLVLTWRDLVRGDSSAWVRLTIVASVLLGAMAVAAARTGFGFERAVLTWHYHGLVELLVPMAVLGWYASTSGGTRGAVLAALGAGLAVATWPTFTVRTFDVREEMVRAGRRCVVEKMARGLPVDCPAAFHSRLDDRLALARQKKLSFVRTLESDVREMRATRSWARDAAYRLGTRIDFRSGGSAFRYKRSGWSFEEPWGTWTVGPQAGLVLRLEGGPPPDLELVATVTPFVVRPRPTLSAEVVANGKVVGRWTFSLDDAKGAERKAVIPASIAGETSPLHIVFRIADPRSPSDVGQVDTRLLGVAFTALSLSARPATPESPGARPVDQGAGRQEAVP
jgi:hypothetical protein